jgi:uncharacterized short protein YbdD (DUF466 family)
MASWSRLWTIVGRMHAGIRWYLREVSGENVYETYLAHCHRHGQTVGILSRREFERRRQDQANRTSPHRCC